MRPALLELLLRAVVYWQNRRKVAIAEREHQRRQVGLLHLQ
jgi:hypothetical protein